MSALNTSFRFTVILSAAVTPRFRVHKNKKPKSLCTWQQQMKNLLPKLYSFHAFLFGDNLIPMLLSLLYLDLALCLGLGFRSWKTQSSRKTVASKFMQWGTQLQPQYRSLHSFVLGTHFSQNLLFLLYLFAELRLVLGLWKPPSPRFQAHCSWKSQAKCSTGLPQYGSLNIFLLGTSLNFFVSNIT